MHENLRVLPCALMQADGSEIVAKALSAETKQLLLDLDENWNQEADCEQRVRPTVQFERLSAARTY
jgi:hypothetical protein